MLRTKNLSFSYPNSPNILFPDIDLSPKEHLLVLGASGSGKTTLLHLLSGLLVANQGDIIIQDHNITQMKRKQMDIFRAQYFGMIFQQYHFIQSLNVEDNLVLRQFYPNRNLDVTRRKAIAERLGLTEVLNHKIYELSQGQKQRLAIALGLIHNPKIVFADEPTSNLDDMNCDKVLALLKEEADISQCNLIIVTHDNRVKSHFSKMIEL